MQAEAFPRRAAERESAPAEQLHLALAVSARPAAVPRVAQVPVRRSREVAVLLSGAAVLAAVADWSVGAVGVVGVVGSGAVCGSGRRWPQPC